jgi:CDGSH-type Zn-finger protein
LGSKESSSSTISDKGEGEAGDGSLIMKEKPKILPLPNGPYYLLNDMKPKIVESLQNLKGEPLSTVSGVALCRCGASNNKPFCDGTHEQLGFQLKIEQHKPVLILLLPTLILLPQTIVVTKTRIQSKTKEKVMLEKK